MPNIKAVSNKPPNLKQAIGIRLAAGFGGLAVLALLAPLIWAAVSAGVGLVVLLLIASTGIGIFQTLPLLAQKWENKVLELRREEARKRPIETLMNYLKQKKQFVKDFKDAVVSIGSQVRSSEDMVAERKRDKPNWDSSRKDKAIAEMKIAHQTLVQKYQAGEKALAELEEIIEDKKFDWKFGQVGGQAIEAMNALNGEDLVEEMLAGEAFDSVRDNYNAVFSALEVEAVKLNSNKALAFDDGMTIDLTSINLNNKVKLGA